MMTYFLQVQRVEMNGQIVYEARPASEGGVAGSTLLPALALRPANADDLASLNESPGHPPEERIEWRLRPKERYSLN